MNEPLVIGSCFADVGAARQAIEMALPMIEKAMLDKEICGSGFLHIVVMDPAIGPRDAPFERAILLEHSIGDRSKWDANYADFARAKAKLGWEHQADSHRVQTTYSHCLRPGDTLLWGGVFLDGIVVAASGAHPWYDEAFATCVAAYLRAIAKQRATARRQARALRAVAP